MMAQWLFWIMQILLIFLEKAAANYDSLRQMGGYNYIAQRPSLPRDYDEQIYKEPLLLLVAAPISTEFPKPLSLVSSGTSYGGFPDRLQIMQNQFDHRKKVPYGSAGRGPGKPLTAGPPYGPLVRAAGPVRTATPREYSIRAIAFNTGSTSPFILQPSLPAGYHSTSQEEFFNQDNYGPLSNPIGHPSYPYGRGSLEIIRAGPPGFAPPDFDNSYDSMELGHGALDEYKVNSNNYVLGLNSPRQGIFSTRGDYSPKSKKSRRTSISRDIILASYKPQNTWSFGTWPTVKSSVYRADKFAGNGWSTDHSLSKDSNF